MTGFSADTPVRTAIDCETTVRRLWDYIDKGLASLSHAEVETHLATCALCARRFAFANIMKDELAKLGNASLRNIDETARAELSSRIRASLRGRAIDNPANNEGSPVDPH